MALKPVAHGAEMVLAFVLPSMVIGLMAQIIGMVTMDWITDTDTGVGLFAYRGGGKTVRIPDSTFCDGGKGLAHGAQAGSIVAAVISILYAGFIFFDLVKNIQRKPSKVLSPCLGGTLICLLFILSTGTWAIWLAWYFNDPCREGAPKDGSAKLGFSFILYVVGSVFSTASYTGHLVRRSIYGKSPVSIGQQIDVVDKFAVDPEVPYKSYQPIPGQPSPLSNQPTYQATPLSSAGRSSSPAVSARQLSPVSSDSRLPMPRTPPAAPSGTQHSSPLGSASQGSWGVPTPSRRPSHQPICQPSRQSSPERTSRRGCHSVGPSLLSTEGDRRFRLGSLLLSSAGQISESTSRHRHLCSVLLLLLFFFSKAGGGGELPPDLLIE